MMDELSSANKNNLQRPSVTSVGNAWVQCSSKSRPGYVYYFNTLSAQSVWNLSPEDIEKAKKFTNALPLSEIEKCPEPAIDPPMDTVHLAALQLLNDQATRHLLPTAVRNQLPMNLHNNNTNIKNSALPTFTDQAARQLPSAQSNKFPMNLENKNYANIPALSAFTDQAARQHLSALPNKFPMHLENKNNANMNISALPGFTDQAARQHLSALPNKFPMNLESNNANMNISALPGFTDQAARQHLSALPNKFPMNLDNNNANMNISALPGLTDQAARQHLTATSNIYPMNLQNTSNANVISALAPNILAGLQTNMTNVPQLPASSGLPNRNGVNPFIWNTSPANPIQNPANNVLYNIYVVPQTPEGLSAQQFSQNTSAPMCNNMNESQENTPYIFKFKEEFPTNKGSYISHTDLRHKLIRKRSKSLSDESSFRPLKTEEPITDFHANIKTAYFENDQLEDTSKFDLSTLDYLKPLNSKFVTWFIVVDTQIILENFPFLNKIIDPDQNCFLVVPDHVMLELQDIVSHGSDMPTRRILRFLNHHIENELAFRGGEITDAADNTYKMLVTCESLALQNNVVLLSNDPKYERTKNINKNVHVFTLQEFKQRLNNKRMNRPPKIKSPTLAIKIHVANDRLNAEARSSTATPQAQDYKSNLQSPSDVDAIQSHSLPPLKVAEQNVPSLNDTPNVNHIQHLDTNLKEDSINHKPHAQTPEPGEKAKCSQTPTKTQRRHITLTRTNTNTANEKPAQVRYGWRRKRDKSAIMEFPKTPVEQSANTEPLIPQETTKEDSSNLSQEISKNVEPSPAQAQSVERSSISSCPKTIDRPNITIEETTTSTGIISNSTEACSMIRKDINKDSESSAKETVSVCEDVSFVRHQVVGASMEEVLRTRREEWVLRFVQIMEEALREMLRETYPSETKCYEYTPWATDLPDLAKYIIKKYFDHFNVVDAANRLAITLHRISDSKGNLSANIEPHQFMDMYSYGVYLIDSLKQVTAGCEDLILTEQSLKKLLYDIQNPYQDSFIQNDTFPDEPIVTVANAAETDKETPRILTRSQAKKQVAVEDQSCSNKLQVTTKVRSKPLTPRKDMTQPNKETQERQFHNTETNFFSSLSLLKRSSENSFVSPNSTPNSARVARTSTEMSSSNTPAASPKHQSNLKCTIPKQVETTQIGTNLKCTIPKQVETTQFGTNLKCTIPKQAETTQIGTNLKCAIPKQVETTQIGTNLKCTIPKQVETTQLGTNLKCTIPKQVETTQFGTNLKCTISKQVETTQFGTNLKCTIPKQVETTQIGTNLKCTIPKQVETTQIGTNLKCTIPKQVETTQIGTNLKCPIPKQVETTQIGTNTKDVNKNDSEQTKEEGCKDAKEPSNTPAVQIVRKFTNIAQFEEKLKEIQSDNYSDDYEYDDNEDDFQEDTEYQEDEDFQEDEEYHDGKYDGNEKSGHEVNILDDRKNIARMKLKCFLKYEFSIPIQLVRDLCTKIIEDLKNARKPNTELQNKLKTAFTTMSKMKTTLKSILDRDSKDIELLQKGNLQSHDNELLTEYTILVKECSKQIEKWHQIVTQIMNGCGIELAT